MIIVPPVRVRRKLNMIQLQSQSATPPPRQTRCLPTSIMQLVPAMMQLGGHWTILATLAVILLVNLYYGSASLFRQLPKAESLFNCALTLELVSPDLLEYDSYRLAISSEHSAGHLSNETKPINSIEVDQLLQLELISSNHNATPTIRDADQHFDPNLPFIFFANGYRAINSNGSIVNTWLQEAARSLTRRTLLASSSASSRFASSRAMEFNVVYLIWNIPQVYMDKSTIGLVTAYYRTMSKYREIVDAMAKTIRSAVSYVESTRSWSSASDRADYYKKFMFFGHSLGAHMMSDALWKVDDELEPKVPLGQLYGLDPAIPCFVSDTLGIRSPKLTNIVDKTILIHSNAGLLGVTGDQSDIQIILNGGTFQPTCSLFDFECSHTYAARILGYIDDQCQMTAYRCPTYQHFKAGACQVGVSATVALPANRSDDFVLVNAPIQHVDSEQVLEFARYSDQVRQTASNDDEHRSLLADVRLFFVNLLSGHLFHSSNGNHQKSEPKVQLMTPMADNDTIWVPQEGREQLHFVNTNSDLNSATKSHCLQHYQLKLLIFSDISAPLCPISSFLLSDGLKMNLSLVYERIDTSLSRLKHKSTAQPKLLMSSHQMRDLIEDKFYTSLVTFPGEARVFVGALIENVDLVKLSQCLTGATVTDRTINFLLDIEFMSNINPKIRQAFSSVLCGHWRADDNSHDVAGGILLSLCKRSDLANVTANINQLLARLDTIQDSWQNYLANSLFQFFTLWSPF